MERKVIQDTVIPAEHGAAFEVKKGQVLRIYQSEEKQVGDCAFFNANDYKEFFSVGATWSMASWLGTGTAKAFTEFYSKPPRTNLMMTVLEDTVKNHSGHMAGRCNTAALARQGRSQRRSCDLNLTEALAPYGLTGDDIMDIFNVFMAAEFHQDGTYTLVNSTAKNGDYIDLLAEMDILAGISACPAPIVINDYTTHSLGVKILE
jgi:uncharacterized protein YcgI (DUF1989 family)